MVQLFGVWSCLGVSLCREMGKCKNAGVAWSLGLFIQGQEVNGSTARVRRSYKKKKKEKRN